MKTFFFYDLETSGLDSRQDRIMQFAGQRTDLDLNPIGDPVNLLVRLSDDTLPSPHAIAVTKITPQSTLADGLTESELTKYLQAEIFTPDTIVTGYNSIRFDDEFMRHLFWRNFYDPYEWQWREGRSRWDLLDVVRLTRALRPEGINWPTVDGKETNRLELITKLNGVSHESAHDALSDVNALIDVTRLIRSKQPQLYDYLLKMRDKREVLKLVNLDDKRPFVYASGRYSSEHHKTTVVMPLTSGRNGNIMVYDLRHDPDQVIGAESYYPIVKELAPNRCPAVAPLGVLEQSDGWSKISLSAEVVETHKKKLLAHPEFAERIRSDLENRPEFPAPIDVESSLYDGFLDDRDRARIIDIPTFSADALADFSPVFDDPRLPELLVHYKARNFPKSLTDAEQKQWEEYRLNRLQSQAPAFIDALQQLSQNPKMDTYILEELKLYYESVMPIE